MGIQGGDSTEVVKPEVFADFLVQFAEDPDCNLTRLAKACGLPRRTARDIVKRLESRYQPVLEETKKVSTKSILKQIDEALPLILGRMSDADLLKNLTMRDAAVASGVLIDKRQLLRGEPTQILSVEERRSMNELTPALIAEMKRRSIVIDVEYEDIPPDSTVVSRTARHQAKREDRERV